LWGDMVVFCTRCYGYVEMRHYPSYSYRCPFCGYCAKVIRRASFKGEVRHLHGLLLVHLRSELGQSLLKLSQENKTAIATQVLTEKPFQKQLVRRKARK
jgi:hypothetical protein